MCVVREMCLSLLWEDQQKFSFSALNLQVPFSCKLSIMLSELKYMYK